MKPLHSIRALAFVAKKNKQAYNQRQAVLQLPHLPPSRMVHFPIQPPKNENVYTFTPFHISNADLI